MPIQYPDKNPNSVEDLEDSLRSSKITALLQSKVNVKSLLSRGTSPTLIVGLIVAAVNLYGEYQALQRTVEDQTQEIEELREALESQTEQYSRLTEATRTRLRQGEQAQQQLAIAVSNVQVEMKVRFGGRSRGAARRSAPISRVHEVAEQTEASIQRAQELAPRGEPLSGF